MILFCSLSVGTLGTTQWDVALDRSLLEEYITIPDKANENRASPEAPPSTGDNLEARIHSCNSQLFNSY